MVAAFGLLVSAATLTAGSAGAASAAKPKRIVSLTATATETLFEIGAGKQVVAVDTQSSYPTKAPRTTLSASRPNVEAIAGYEPDLVVLSSPAVADQIRALGITVLVLPAAKTLTDAYDQMRVLGQASGHRAAAATLVERVRTDINGLKAQVSKRRDAPAAYYELTPSLFSVDSTTFIGQLIKLAGLRNIADAAVPASSGYPQLSAEFVVQANPAVILLADTKCCAQNTTSVATRAGFAQVAAVRNSRIVELDDDIASRWGPRVVELFRQIIAASKSA
jgi:iron complex transport system substrate-binding protein